MTLTHAFRRSVENSLQIQRITKNCVRYHWSVRNSWFIVIVLFYRTFLLRANADTSGLLDKFSCFWYTRLRTETPAGRIDVPVQLATKQNTRWMNWLVKEIKNKMKKKGMKNSSKLPSVIRACGSLSELSKQAAARPIAQTFVVEP